MAALINALDTHTSSQFGENGHIEYGWSNDIQERIVQFSFQLVRTDAVGITRLQNTLSTMLTLLSTISPTEKAMAKKHLTVLYKLNGQTRDIVEGKGEYYLSYMMIYVWYKFFPELAKFALKCFVDIPSSHQYGSWKDMKYFCKYCKEKDGITHPLIDYSVKLLNARLKLDSLVTVDTELSLVSKWIPREKTEFAWLFELLSRDYFPEYLVSVTTTNNNKEVQAILKCKMNYRKLVSGLNKRIDTVQIKQCGLDWTSIDFNKVTSVSLSKQKKAFLNIKKNGEVRFPMSEDRNSCAKHFSDRIKKAASNEGLEMKGARVSMESFTTQAINLILSPSSIEVDLLNSQWRNNSAQTGALGKMIAMVDVSGSMKGDPMNVAIALGIRIAEKSILGKRMLTFHSVPTWVNLDPYPTFVSQVETVVKAPWGMNTNFQAALDLILSACVSKSLTPIEVEDMVLVILSDMQMDAGDSCDKMALYDTMKAKYGVHGYKPPHILFWNLRSTSGFPTLSSQPNTSMMSGFSPALLNLFCEEGMSGLSSCTPWSLLVKSLENKRYDVLENWFDLTMDTCL